MANEELLKHLENGTFIFNDGTLKVTGVVFRNNELLWTVVRNELENDGEYSHVPASVLYYDAE